MVYFSAAPTAKESLNSSVARLLARGSAVLRTCFFHLPLNLCICTSQLLGFLSWALADGFSCMQDPDGWCDLTQFDLPEEPSAGSSSSSNSPVRQTPSKPTPSLPNVTEYRLDGHTISDLSKSSKGELIPISPHAEVSFGTPPSVLKRQKKRKISLSPVTENAPSTSLSFLDSCNSMTPKSTPVKTLPFSPSQVWNSGTGQSGLLCLGLFVN